MLGRKDQANTAWLKIREGYKGVEDGAVFLSERGTALDRRQVNYLLKRYGEKAGLGFTAHPHMLRHACGYALANSGHDTRAIQTYMGHRSTVHHYLYRDQCKTVYGVLAIVHYDDSCYLPQLLLNFIIGNLMALSIFVSSTIRHLANAREYIKSSIENLGHTPVMSEHDDVGYITGAPLENSCYTAIRPCQILISIIDDYFGSESELDSLHSISNCELMVAIKQKKQIYIFINDDINTIFSKWKQAKENGKKFTKKSVKELYGCDIRVLEFIEYIKKEAGNKYLYIGKFKKTEEIIVGFRKQLSGLLSTMLIQREVELLGQS